MPKLWRRSRALAQFCLPLIFSRVAILVLAGVVVVSLFIPWQQAAPRTYPGLDPNLLYINSKGTGTQSGDVRISGDRAVLTAREASAPTIHLVSSESDFSAEFDVTPSAAALPWQTATVTVHPPPGTRNFAVLVGAKGGTIVFHSITVAPVTTGGALSAPVFADDFTNPKVPNWVPATDVDRVTGSGLRVTASGAQEVGAYTRLLGLPQPEATYLVTGQFRSVSGLPTFKIAIDWLDSQQRHISYSADWKSWETYAQPFVPATISLWHPRKYNAVNLEFTSSLQPKIAVVTQDSGSPSLAKELADYEAGQTYHITLVWKHGHSALFRIKTPEAKTLFYAIDRQSGLGLFDEPFVNLSVGTSAPPGVTNSLEIRHVKLMIPSQTRFAQTVSDWRLTVLTGLIVIWLTAYAATYLFLHVGVGSTLRTWFATAGGRLKQPRNAAIAVAIVGLSSLYAASTIIDGHPFDRLSQESAAYVIDQYGVGALYGRTSVVPDSIVRGGTGPWSPAEFVYPPGMANFFIVVGKTWQLFNHAPAPLGSQLYTSFWKFAFAIFVLVAAGLIFAISRRTNGGWRNWALLLAGLFAISPALVFDVAVWGQSNGLLLAILLLATLALVLNRPQLMWSAIVVAVLVKQTALLVAPLIVLFALRRYGLRRSLTYAAFGIVVGFVFIAPSLFAGYSPATSVMTTIGKLADFGTPLTPYNTTVSADTFPIWVVLTGMRSFHGIDRLWTTDRETVPLLGMSYSSAGLVLFILIALIAAWAVWREAGRPTPSYQRLFVSIALVVVAYVSLNTRTSGHYLILAIPFILLGLPRAAPVSAFWKLAAVSGLALISEYGLFMFIAAKGEWPNFAVLGSPSTNTFSALVYAIYTYDGFITLFAVLMFLVMVRLLLEVATDLRRRVMVPAHVTPEVVRETAGSAV
jgi:hypothetical protein